MKIFFALIISLATVTHMGVSRADEPDEGAKQMAAKIAVGTCATCHGRGGNSTMPKFPKLSGQLQSYLIAQLKAFKTQTRGDSDALAYMWGMAAQLDDETITALAQYYASQKPTSGTASKSADLARGKEIYERGIPSEKVAPCMACHGPDAGGVGDFPRLAGQHADYMIKQLYSFRNNMRNVALMHGVAKEMKTEEMEAVAAYLQSK